MILFWQILVFLKYVWSFYNIMHERVKKVHCVKSVRIWSYSDPHFPVFGLNTNQNISENGHFLHSVRMVINYCIIFLRVLMTACSLHNSDYKNWIIKDNPCNIMFTNETSKNWIKPVVIQAQMVLVITFLQFIVSDIFEFYSDQYPNYFNEVFCPVGDDSVTTCSYSKKLKLTFQKTRLRIKNLFYVGY